MNEILTSPWILCVVTLIAAIVIHWFSRTREQIHEEAMLSEEERKLRRERFLQQAESRARHQEEERKCAQDAIEKKESKKDAKMVSTSAVQPEQEPNAARDLSVASKRRKLKSGEHPLADQWESRKPVPQDPTPERAPVTKAAPKPRSPRMVLQSCLSKVFPGFQIAIGSSNEKGVLVAPTDDWGALKMALLQAKLWKKTNGVKQLLDLHQALVNESTLKYNTKKEELIHCLTHLMEHLRNDITHLVLEDPIQHVGAKALAPWLSATSNAYEDLFGSIDPRAVVLEGPVHEWLAAIEASGVMNTDVWDNVVTSRASGMLLVQQFYRIAKGLEPLNMAPNSLTGLTTLLVHSSDIRDALVEQMESEVKAKASNGKELESNALLQPLLARAAFTTLQHGSEMWRNQLKSDISGFPLSVYERDRAKQDTVRRVLNSTRQSQQSAMRAASTALQRATLRNKAVVMQWLGQIADLNEPLTEMIRADLDDQQSGVLQLSSSWPYLLGTSWTVLNTCIAGIEARFSKKGMAAFELQDTTGGVLVPRLDAPTNVRKCEGFFPISSLLLRSSLFPFLRVERTFRTRYRDILAMLQDCASSQRDIPPHLVKRSLEATTLLLGFDCFLRDTEFNNVVTRFSLLQLKWVNSVLQSKDRRTIGLLPDWLCKEAARWLAHVANTDQSHLSPVQAEETMQLVIQLLSIGSQDNDLSFSPVVLSEFIRVATAFVFAGVALARRNERKSRSRNMDRRGMGNYTSLNRNDLGVTVFSNPLVKKDLCPTLIRTFRAVDHVEGLDVDKEASFDKYSAKGEIVELLIRLWGHPDGECKQSVLKMPSADIADFMAAVVATWGFFLDDACQRFTVVARSVREHGKSMFDRSNMQDLRGAVSNFAFGRKVLQLLYDFSNEPTVIKAVISCTKSSNSIASMMVRGLDTVTSDAGGLNESLDLLGESSISQYEREPSMAAEERTSLVEKLVSTRRDVFRDVGLHAGVLSHQILAFLTRVYFSSGESLDWIRSLYTNDDCEPKRYLAILKRMIQDLTSKSQESHAQLVFLTDGYSGFDPETGFVDTEEVSHTVKSLRASAQQDQMHREEVSAIASNSDIKQFLLVLESHQKDLASQVLKHDDVAKLQTDMMSTDQSMDASEYGERMKNWVTNSEPFWNSQSDDGSLHHYFEKKARSRATQCSVQVLMKRDAKQCNSVIPHANSAIYVCFSEERMDLCRAAVTGPVDTPYAHGMFVFDVSFPPTYPDVPPLVQYMTTGGGQVRFGPNLYSDGKVCLSLLGNFFGGGKSEKWNPEFSSLKQILLSIQTQLLTSDPYFLEPGKEAKEGTRQGREDSRLYNIERRLYTMRHAMIDYLKDPPLGFADVVQQHFGMCRVRIMAQAKRWVLEARQTPWQRRTQLAYGELVSLLAHLDGDHMLPPLKEDLEYLGREDPAFPQPNVPTTVRESEQGDVNEDDDDFDAIYE